MPENALTASPVENLAQTFNLRLQIKGMIADKETLIMRKVCVRQSIETFVIVVLDHVMAGDAAAGNHSVADVGCLSACMIFGRDNPASGLRTMVKENAELLPFSRWVMKRLSPPKSAWKVAQFLRRSAVMAGSFLSCLDSDRAAELDRPHIVAGKNEPVGSVEIIVALVEERRVRRKVADPAMRTHRLHQLEQLAVVRGHHPAFHGRYMVGEERAERRQVSERSALRPWSSASIDLQLSSMK